MEDDIRSGTMRRGLYFVIGIVLSVLGLIGIGVCGFKPRDTPF